MAALAVEIARFPLFPPVPPPTSQTYTAFAPAGFVQVPVAVNSETLTVAPAATVAKIAPPAPFAWSSCPDVAAPEEIAEDPTAPAAILAATIALSASAAEPTAPAAIFSATMALSARCDELMLEPMIDTVEVPDEVDTDAGDVPMTEFT